MANKLHGTCLDCAYKALEDSEPPCNACGDDYSEYAPEGCPECGRAVENGHCGTCNNPST